MSISRPAFRLAAAGLLGAVLALPQAAKAWGHVGVYIGVPPLVVGPPVVPYGYGPLPYGYAYPYPYYGYYGPAYYGPPPAAPAPQDQQHPATNVPFGMTCFAGFYSCAAPPKTPVGAGCACPGLGAPSYGTVH